MDFDEVSALARQPGEPCRQAERAYARLAVTEEPPGRPRSGEEDIEYARKLGALAQESACNLFSGSGSGPHVQAAARVPLPSPPVLAPAETHADAPVDAHAHDIAQGRTALRALIADYGATVVWHDVVMTVFRAYPDGVHRLPGGRP